MSSIPVVVMGIKRAQSKAIKTKKHFNKLGFNNVSIFYGLDLKGKNPEKVKSNQVVSYNNFKILEENKDKPQLIIAEDDARITNKEGLMKHLKKGIKGIDRLIWNRKVRIKGKDLIQNTALIGYDTSGIKKALTLTLGDGHWDLALSKKTNQKVSGPFGIEYLYPDMKKKGGIVIGLDEKHIKIRGQEEISRKYDKGEDIPLTYKRYGRTNITYDTL